MPLSPDSDPTPFGKDYVMKRKLTVLTLLSVIGLCAIANGSEKNLQKRSRESLVGIWKGKFEETPAVDIALKVKGDTLVGTVVFYMVEEAGVAKSTDKLELLQPSFDGNVLSFQVKRKDGSFFKGRIKFIAENEAVLHPGDEARPGDARAISLTREK
jgi:hypothetical protein